MKGWEQVYQAYFLDVYRYALSLCRERALAEDLTSDTFLKGMDAFYRFRGDCPVNVWLCRITRNLYISHLRKHGRVIPVEEIPEPEVNLSNDPADLVGEKDAGERALMVTLALPEPGRQIVLLRSVQGMSFAQIAALYQKSENWACVVYHRARKKLKETLEVDDGISL
ncbi:MAG: sigma-70 family RNA polymerase sigma factor [Clostridiales bacterium]|nr:sigma-70 family RNA polymerase sigma factor [Clostridiales bacterium]